MINRLSEKLSDKEKQTFELLSDDPGYTSLQIAEQMKVSRILVTNYLKTMKEKWDN